MGLSGKNEWKPKQKLRAKDVEILLIEYNVSRRSLNVFLTLIITMTAILFTSIGWYILNQNATLINIIVICILGVILFALGARYYWNKAYKIAKVLGVRECLERYGIKSKKSLK